MNWLGLLIGILFQFYAVPAQTSSKKIASTNVKTMQGESFNTSRLDNNGKPMIVVMWRTDNRSCFQYFQALNEELTDLQTQTGVKVVIFSLDPPRTAPEVLPMVMARKWDFESYIDTYQEFKSAMGVIGIPYTFVVNGKKEVVWEKHAYSPGMENEVFEIVRKVAKEAKAD